MDVRNARRERRREQARDEILAAARVVLLRKGVSGLTLSAVARELQLTKAALYYYFDSKEALVFELVYGGLRDHAEIVGAAIDETSSGAEAIETLIRVSTEHYAAHRDDLRLAYMVPQVGTGVTDRFTPAMLEQVRPFNELLYGNTAKRIRADQERGSVPASIDARRFAFLAHMAVIGMLTVEGVVEAVDTAPLIHTRQAMVDELVRTFTARLAQEE